MAGLLDFLNTPEGVGLLSAVASGAAGARRGTPWNNVGRGLVGGLAGYSAFNELERQKKEDAFNQQYKQMQMGQMQFKMDEAKRAQEAVAKRNELFQGLAPKYSTPTYGQFQADDPFNQGQAAFGEIYGGQDHGNVLPTMNMAQTGSKLDMAALQAALPEEMARAGYIDEAMAMMPKPKEPLKVGKNDRVFDPNTYKELIGAMPEPVDYNKPFLPDGTPNEAYQKFKLSDSKAGASTITNKIENKTGESLAGQVGPMLKDSRTRAVGAVKMADSAERLEKALNSGKVIAGPFATKRMFINQIGSAMGITGPESVTQTRQVIRALAESSVEARKELQGQGQVTENEAKAVEKAMSGNIDDFTVDELKALVSLNKKAAKFSVEQHQFLLDQAETDPATKGVGRFYKVPGADRVMKYQFGAQEGNKSALSPAEQKELEQLRKRFGK